MTITLSETDKQILARHSPSVRGRALIELQVVDALIKAAQDNAFHLEIDGEGEGPDISTRRVSADAFKSALFDLDMATVYVSRGTFGWIRLVFGNDGWDLISDYSTNLETFLEPVNAVADFWGQ